MNTLWQYAKKYVFPLWIWFVAGFVFLAITNLITLEIPLLAKKIVNGLNKGTDLKNPQSIALLIIALGLIQILIRWFSRIFIFWPGRKFEANSRADLFAKVLELPQKIVSKFQLGDLVSRIANDTGYLRVFFAFGALAIANLAYLLVFTVSRMIRVHPLLTLFCLIPFLLMLVYTRFAMPWMHRLSLANQEALGRLSARATEAFSNVHVIQANAAANTFADRVQVENKTLYTSNIKLIAMETIVFPLIAFLAGLSQLVVLFYGSSQVIKGALSVGDILVFNVYIGYLAFPLSVMGAIIALLQRARSALSRMSEIENQKSENVNTKTGKKRNRERKKTSSLLEIKNLNFTYPDNLNEPDKKKRRPAALKNINLKIYPGNRIGIFAPVGSGKSTLFSLITRIYDPPKGTIFFNSEDILKLNPRELRNHIGYTLQTAYLFSDSIINNLNFGLETIPDKSEIEEVLKNSAIYDEITEFPDGLKTEIGEKGVRLSGGQKQRLALARIFLRKPKLIILDDVLSAVDQTTEQKLIKYIHKTQAAVLIASHRTSALRQCDEVLIMLDGSIVDRGTYKELERRHKYLYEEFNVERE